MEKQIISINELLQLNETMLGRGMPVEEDGIGYNKADYGACANYYHGLSNAQIADLAKRLVKYCNTQLGIDKQLMKDTSEHYKALAEEKCEVRENGISIDVREDGVLVSFKYDETFINIVKKQPKRKYDAETKSWIVPFNRIMPTLNELWTVGADVNNAMVYIMHNDTYLDWLDTQQEMVVSKEEVLTKIDGDYALLKFKYNKDILDEIKTIDRKDRQWNADSKFWVVRKNYLDMLKDKLSDIAVFKQM